MRIKEEGVTRKLVGMELGGDPLRFEFPDYQPAFHDGSEVGRVTLAVWSPRLEKNIGYVWVPIELAEPGTVLEVEAPDGARIDAQTASLPFYDPKKKIPAA